MSEGSRQGSQAADQDLNRNLGRQFDDAGNDDDEATQTHSESQAIEDGGLSEDESQDDSRPPVDIAEGSREEREWLREQRLHYLPEERSVTFHPRTKEEDESRINIELDELLNDDPEEDPELWRKSMLLATNVRDAETGIVSLEKTYVENVYNGSFALRMEEERRRRRAGGDTKSQEEELQGMLRSVEVLWYLDNTSGLWARGTIGGMSLLTLSSSYLRCSKEDFAYCYAISSGFTITLFHFLLNFCALLSLIQFYTAKPSDPQVHRTLLGATTSLYWLSLLVTIFVAGVDDQIENYANNVQVGVSTAANLGVGFVTEQMWHVCNVTRLTALITAWLITCIDRVYLHFYVTGAHRYSAKVLGRKPNYAPSSPVMVPWSSPVQQQKQQPQVSNFNR